MRRSSGFTVIELMIVVGILAIIVAMAAPSFNSLILSSRIDSALSTVRSAFVYARSEAALQQANVVICSSADQATCTDDDDWAVGWLIFIDDGDADYDATNDCDPGEDCLLRVGQGLTDGATLEEGSTPVRTVQVFNPDGSIPLNSGVNLSLEISDECGAGQMPVLQVNNVGRVDVTMGDC